LHYNFSVQPFSLIRVQNLPYSLHASKSKPLAHSPRLDFHSQVQAANFSSPFLPFRNDFVAALVVFVAFAYQGKKNHEACFYFVIRNLIALVFLLVLSLTVSFLRQTNQESVLLDASVYR